MSFKGYDEADAKWKCVECGGELTPGTVVITYLGSEFTAELMRCEQCGFVLISEDLATGKMLEVEKLLEDK